MSSMSSNIEVVHAKFPEIQQPGERWAHIAIRNRGDETVNLKIGSPIDRSIVVNAKRTTTFNHEYTLLDSPYEVDADIVDKGSGKVVANISKTVTPHKFVSINTNSGRVNVVGGYEEPSNFDIKMIGSGVGGGNSVVNQRKVLGGLDDKLIRGQLSNDEGQTATFDFNKLEVFDAHTHGKMQWIVDGKLKGRSTEFRYSTIAGEALFDSPNNMRSKDRIMVTRRPRVRINAGPSSRIGGLRQRSGLGSRIFNVNSVTEMLTTWRN